MSAASDANTKSLGMFENLALIPTLLEKIEGLEAKVERLENALIPDLDLTKRAGVRTYLDISESTLSTMMKDGRLKQGIHFTKELKENRTKITFIESAIKNYKENL